MKITVIGAGAIGGVIGACLVRGGCQVTLIDTDSGHVKKMQEQGLTIVEPEGRWNVPVKAFTVEEYLAQNREAVECVLLCVKAQHTLTALEPFFPLLGPESFVVSVQNGLSEYEIAKQIGRERTVGAFVNIFSDYLEPGVINYGGKGSLVLGEMDGTISPRLIRLAKELKGLDHLELSDNVFGYLWGKLGYADILAATSLTNETMADIFDNQRYRVMLMNLASEILEVAVKEGIPLPVFDDWDPGDAYPRENRDIEKMNRQLDIHVKRLRTYTKVHSGIWRDIAVRHRKTEMPAQLHVPLELGKEKYGLKFPLTELNLKMLGELEEGKREFSLENLERLLELNQNVYE